jgi:hypothetical protein
VIGRYAFANCSSLSSICIPSSVEKLSDYCFEECQSLSTIEFEIDSHLSRVEQSVFSGCSSLSSIWIPSSLRCQFGGYEGVLQIITTDH